jgi:hypothetical protein
MHASQSDPALSATSTAAHAPRRSVHFGAQPSAGARSGPGANSWIAHAEHAVQSANTGGGYSNDEAEADGARAYDVDARAGGSLDKLLRLVRYPAMSSLEPLLNDRLTEPHGELRCSILFQCQAEFRCSAKNVDNYQLRPRIGRYGFGEFDDGELAVQSQSAFLLFACVISGSFSDRLLVSAVHSSLKILA